MQVFYYQLLLQTTIASFNRIDEPLANFKHKKSQQHDVTGFLRRVVSLHYHQKLLF